MTCYSSMSVFHQWLLADSSSKASACAIVLHGDSARIANTLVPEIADYLNEYDDDGEGRWFAATGDLLATLADDENHRRLLGMDEPAGDAAAELRATIVALCRRGHIVLHLPGSADPSLDLPNAFHVGIGGCDGQIRCGRCHVILDPELMPPKCLARVVGDVFLEWIHSEIRRSSQVSDIR